MKSTGYVRQLDDLGRIVLPIELRRKFDINFRDGLEIFTDKDFIIMRKYQPACIFCGSGENVKIFRDKRVCKKCLNDIIGKVV